MGSAPEIIVTATGFLLIAVYHIHFIHKVRTAPLSTALGLTNHLRRHWVETIMKEKRDILAVQTLRNWIMASSLLASTAILIGLGITTVAFKPGEIVHLSHHLDLFGAKSPTLWLVNLMVLMIDFFFAFFNFTLSIRYYSHASLAINVPASEDPLVTYDGVAAIISRGAIHYTLGMRGYYLAVPLTLWLFGPTWLLAGSFIMTLILYKLDRTA